VQIQLINISWSGVFGNIAANVTLGRESYICPLRLKGALHLNSRGLIAVSAYIGTIFVANWSIHQFGMVSVGFGLIAPAGVYFAGLAFWLRDIVQDTLGKRWSIAAIVAGALFSAVLSPALALASGAAFLLSELLDLAVYTPLRQRNLYAAVAASNAVGLLVDSVLFLLLAFGSLDFLAGQVVGKAWMTLLALVLIAGYRQRARVA
jgi:hypothetical protein